MVICVVLAAAGWAGKTIRLETELLALLPQDLPSVRGLDAFARQFASDQELVLVVGEDMPALQRKQVLRKIRPVLASLPDVASVRAPGEEWRLNAPLLAAWTVWNLPSDQFRKLTAALEPQRVRATLAALPETLSGALSWENLMLRQFDPLGLLQVLTGEHENFLGPSKPQPPSSLLITATRPLVSFQDCAAFYESIRSAVQRTLPGESRLMLTGRPAFTAEISTQMRHDMMIMIGVAMALASLAFWAFYRSFKPLGWILLGQFLALGMALVGARLFIGSLNVVSMGFGCVLLGIGMDYSILVYHHFASPLRDDRAVWQRLNYGIWFSAATTAAAFLVLAFASVPGVRQLAALVAVGLIACAGFATWLLPAVWLRSPPQALPFVQRVSASAAAAMQKRGVALLGVSLVTVTLGAYALVRDPQAIYESDLNRFQPFTSQAFQAQRLLEKRDPSATDAIYLVLAPTWEAAKAAAAQLANHFPQENLLPRLDLMPAPALQAANRSLWPSDVLPALRAAFTDAELGTEWSRSTLAFCEALTAAASGSGDAFAALEPMLSKLQRQTADGVRSVVRIPGMAEHPLPASALHRVEGEVLPVSWIALKAELNEASMEDMKRLAGGALAAIVVLCALAQRSVRLVLLNLAALALTVLLAAELLVLTGTQLSAFSLLCVPLLLGLAIDYSLHVLMALEHDRGDFTRLYAHIGAPILLTALASCIGFGVPMLTRQPVLQNFGLVMDLGIVSAVFVCLFLLPVLARLTASHGPERELSPEREAP